MPPADENWYGGGEFSFERGAGRPAPRRRAGRDERLPILARGTSPSARPWPFYEHAAIYAGEILTGEKKKPVGRPRKLI
ncbi:MAG: hypothetical protein ACLUEQ_08040 [Cloacibacillus evryensis]